MTHWTDVGHRHRRDVQLEAVSPTYACAAHFILCATIILQVSKKSLSHRTPCIAQHLHRPDVTCCLVPSDQVGLEAPGGGTARLQCPARTKIMFIPHMFVFVRGRSITVIDLSQRVELFSKLFGHKEWVGGQPPANARVHVEFRLAQDCSRHLLMRDINPNALFGLLLHPNEPSEPQSQPQTTARLVVWDVSLLPDLSVSVCSFRRVKRRQ